MSNYLHSRNILAKVGIVGLLVALAACTPRIDVRGNLPDPERLSEITPGEQSRAEVAEILGTPSSVAMFDKETWYYVSQRTETLAFFEPEIKERNIVILQFDKKGIVSNVRKLGAEDGKDVLPVERTTPTSGNTLNFWDQIFSNIGRFN